MSKYIIIDAEAIQKRIEDLKKDSIHSEWKHNIKTHNGHSPQQRERKKMVDLELNILEEILSQSTPLIPEIEKAFDEGSESPRIAGSYPTFERLKEQQQDKQDYISNLKLDI